MYMLSNKFSCLIWFSISKFSPSLEYTGHKWEPIVGWVDKKEGSFEYFCDKYFSAFFPGETINVETSSYDSEGSYVHRESYNKSLMCKVVSITKPQLNFTLTSFQRNLKSFEFRPGQIILEISNGEKIPVFSNVAKVERETSQIRITQTTSREFNDIFMRMYDDRVDFTRVD